MKTSLLFILTFLTVNVLFSQDIVFDKECSPHVIYEDLTTEKDQKVIFEAGAEIIVYDSVNITINGNVWIKGTVDSPILIRGKSRVPGWGTMKIINGDKFELKNVHFKDGIIVSHQKENHISDCYFNNKQILNWQYALVRILGGKVIVENSTFIGDKKVEGVLIHDSKKPIVRNCYFEKVPDAVEYLSCKDGIIYNNKMINSYDDAIDLNGCQNIVISNNEIVDYHNAAFEIGAWHSSGKSTNINLSKNKITGGDNVYLIKEASDVFVFMDEIEGTNNGININTLADCTNVSKITLSDVKFRQINNEVIKDSISIVEIVDRQ